MKNVIEFPKTKTRKAKSIKRSEAKQAVLSLSIVTLIMGFVFINDAMTRSERTSYLISDNNTNLQSLNRAIASAQPMNPFRDLEWEQSLAKKLGKELADERIPASIGRKITVLEELQLATLKWKYSILNQPSGNEVFIKEISYVESQDIAEQPEFVDPEKLLKGYKELWIIPFASFEAGQDDRNPTSEMKAAETSHRTYKLYDSSHNLIGRAVFTFNHEDRFLSLKFQAISVQ